MLDQDDNIQSISVVMVSYHTGDVLWRSIDSVLKAEGLKELIIVDNGNPEEITHEIKQLSEKDQRVSLLTGTVILALQRPIIWVLHIRQVTISYF